MYRIKISPSKSQREASLNVSLIRNENSRIKTVLLADEALNVFFEPPTVARFIQLQTISDKAKISLCEVEAYGTGTFFCARKFLNFANNLSPCGVFYFILFIW